MNILPREKSPSPSSEKVATPPRAKSPSPPPSPGQRHQVNQRVNLLLKILFYINLLQKENNSTVQHQQSAQKSSNVKLMLTGTSLVPIQHSGLNVSIVNLLFRHQMASTNMRSLMPLQDLSASM